MSVVHWDDVERRRRDYGVLHGAWSLLGEALETRGVGLRRIELAPGEVPTPAHMHTDEEEIFFVLAGSGLSWQGGETYELRAGDCIVHPARGPAHTLRAGDAGLDVLAFGTRSRPGAVYLPNSQTAWLLPTWVDAGTGAHPYEREPELDWPAPSPRPTSIVNVDEIEGDYGGLWKRLGAAAGATRSGLNWAYLPPNEEGAAPHCHSADDELFVILDGEGILELWGRAEPGNAPATEPRESQVVRAGHVVSRPAGTGISHCLRTRERSMTYLAYGTREPDDVIYYPRGNTVYFRGIGLIARLEPLAYGDGEPG